MSLQVLVNITLTYAIRENKIYEQCKGLIQFNFEQNNFQVTAPFRQSFSPLGCPTISTNNGAVLVDEEYFCTTGKKIKFQPEGYTSPIDVCGKMLSFSLHGAFQLSMIGILNLGYWTEATSCRQHGFFTFTSLCIPTFVYIHFVFLHSFLFSLYSYIPLYSNLSWDFLRCAVRPGLAGVCAVSSCPSSSWCSPIAVSPQLLEAKPERRRAERKLRATRLHTHKRIYSFTPPSSYTMRKLHSSSFKSKHALHPNSYNARSQTSGLKPSHWQSFA